MNWQSAKADQGRATYLTELNHSDRGFEGRQPGSNARATVSVDARYASALQQTVICQCGYRLGEYRLRVVFWRD
jgi:hypothetical protein